MRGGMASCHRKWYGCRESRDSRKGGSLVPVIDKDGINANSHVVRNVADGEVSATSKDAVNGSQLYHSVQALKHNINQTAAGAAAMANLHPLEYDPDDKVSIAASVGSYKDQQALALGAFYRPDAKTMISVSGSLGNNDNMLGIGVSKKIGNSTKPVSTNKQLQKEVTALSSKNTELENKLSAMSTAYQALLEKVDALAQKITK